MFWYGFDPLRFNSCKVKVKEGKCLKNDNSESLKFSSPSKFLVANTFTFSVTVSAKLIGSITKASKEITKVIPVMAHIERYLHFTNIDSIYEMMSMDVLGQVNCSSMTALFSRKKTLKFIDNEIVHVIGTDTHNADLRPPLFGEAKEIIYKKQSAECFKRLMTNAEKILNNAELDDIING